MAEAVRGAPSRSHAVVLDAEGLTHVDSAGLEALVAVIAALEEEGIELRVARMKSPVRVRLDEGGVADRIGRSAFTRRCGPPSRRRRAVVCLPPPNGRACLIAADAPGVRA